MTKLEKLANEIMLGVLNNEPEVYYEGKRTSLSWEQWMVEFSKNHPRAWKKYFAKIFPGYEGIGLNMRYKGI